MDGRIHIVVEVAQVFKDGGPCFRLGQLITDVLKGNALGERAPTNAAHTVRVPYLLTLKTGFGYHSMAKE